MNKEVIPFEIPQLKPKLKKGMKLDLSQLEWGKGEVGEVEVVEVGHNRFAVKFWIDILPTEEKDVFEPEEDEGLPNYDEIIDICPEEDSEW